MKKIFKKIIDWNRKSTINTAFYDLEKKLPKINFDSENACFLFYLLVRELDRVCKEDGEKFNAIFYNKEQKEVFIYYSKKLLDVAKMKEDKEININVKVTQGEVV